MITSVSPLRVLPRMRVFSGMSFVPKERLHANFQQLHETAGHAIEDAIRSTDPCWSSGPRYRRPSTEQYSAVRKEALWSRILGDWSRRESGHHCALLRNIDRRRIELINRKLDLTYSNSPHPVLPLSTTPTPSVLVVRAPRRILSKTSSHLNQVGQDRLRLRPSADPSVFARVDQPRLERAPRHPATGQTPHHPEHLHRHHRSCIY